MKGVGENPEQLAIQVYNKLHKRLKTDLKGYTEEELGEAVVQAVMRIHPEEREAIEQISKKGTSNLCSACGYCCKEYQIHISMKDIERLSQRINPVDYIESTQIGDGGFIFKDLPCKFHQTNGRCDIYHYRPQSCRNYPLIQPTGTIQVSRDPNCNYVNRFFILKALSILTNTRFGGYKNHDKTKPHKSIPQKKSERLRRTRRH